MTTLHITPKPIGAAPGVPPLNKNYLSTGDLSPGQIHAVLETAQQMKACGLGPWSGALAGKTVVMLFEKPSLRTRLSFDVGLTKMGAHAIYYDAQNAKLGDRESVEDQALVIDRYADAVVARVFSHADLEQYAGTSDGPVINALSDAEHPCQALADMLTLKEAFGTLDGIKLAYIGDGNNVCNSLLLMGASLGIDVTAITPRGFEPSFELVRKASKIAETTGVTITLSHDPAKVAGHHAVYTDTWLSMGQGHQQAIRDGKFAAYQVSEELMSSAGIGLGPLAGHGGEGREGVCGGGAKFLHCLPAHRGEEVTPGVIDGEDSLVYDQAENRLWAQAALLAHLFGKA